MSEEEFNDAIAKFDQGATFLGDNLPNLWKRMYDRCVEVGFDKDQAMALVRTYVFGAANGRMER